MPKGKKYPIVNKEAKSDSKNGFMEVVRKAKGNKEK
jgi:hypothetical protein